MKQYIELELLLHDDAAVAKVVVDILDGRTFIATGSSKRHPNDAVDPEIGAAYAVGRALRALGAEINAWADRKVALEYLQKRVADFNDRLTKDNRYKIGVEFISDGAATTTNVSHVSTDRV